MYISRIHKEHDTGEIKWIYLNFEIEDLLNTLDNYQKDNITSLLQTNTLEQTFEIWLKANGPENTASFGGNDIMIFRHT